MTENKKGSGWCQALWTCPKCSQKLMVVGVDISTVDEAIDHAKQFHNNFRHPTLWQRVKAWWRK